MDIRTECGFARIFLHRHYGTTTQTSAQHQRHRSQLLPLFADWPVENRMARPSTEATSKLSGST